MFMSKKIEDAVKNLKNLSVSALNYFPSHHISFSQAQTGATVPLKAAASLPLVGSHPVRDSSTSVRKTYFSRYLKGRVVDPDPDGSEIICMFGSGSVI
jgi:hypothetical protein